jgi:hypothetical protein
MKLVRENSHTSAFVMHCLLGCIAGTIVLALVSCKKQPVAPVGPGLIAPSISKATYQAYKDGGWTPLPEPDSRYVPGTIFEVIVNQNPRWMSSLQSCGVPADVLAPVSNNSGDFKYSGTSNYGASAVLTIKGVTAGPDFKKAQTAEFDQSDAGGSSVDIVKLGSWLAAAENQNKFNSFCKTLLAKPDMYIATESYRVGSGTYSLKDTTDAKLQLKGLNIKVLNISADANADLSGDSTLTLKVPVYTAVHKAIYANNFLQTLGNPTSTPAYADQKINQGLPY